MTDKKMAGWHHHLNGPEFAQAPGDGEGQESLAVHSLIPAVWVGHGWAPERRGLSMEKAQAGL